MSGLGDAYSGRDFPFLVVEGTVAGEALIPSNFTGTESLGGQLVEATGSLHWSRNNVPQTLFDATSLATCDSVRLLSKFTIHNDKDNVPNMEAFPIVVVEELESFHPA